MKYHLNLVSFSSKIDDIVYFNPRQSVGIATTVGISSSISVSVGDTTTTVSVPAQSIYLPNHPFKTGQQITLQTDGNSAIQVSRDGSNSSIKLLQFHSQDQVKPYLLLISLQITLE